jgi:uncharacterized membrane protein YadS
VSVVWVVLFTQRRFEMNVEYSLLGLALALVYGIITKFFPDFPISPEILLTFVVYVLLKLGVNVIGAPVRKFLSRGK